jgi:Ca-activated chloride channel family protein
MLTEAAPFLAAQLGVVPGEVRIPVVVTEKRGQFVTGLQSNVFHLLEDNVEQKITSFAEVQNAPLTVGIILDISASMKPIARGDVARFKRLTGSDNEYFLIGFAETLQVRTAFTPDLSNLLTNIGLNTPATAANTNGKTALYDAMYAGLVMLEKASHPQKALVVISDGEDNKSRYTLREVQDAFRSSNVQLFFAGENKDLRNLAEETGGLSFDLNGLYDYPGTNRWSLAGFANEVVSNIGYQYVLGYRPVVTANKANRRTIRINLAAPGNADPQWATNVKSLKTRSRTKYYLPPQK